MAKPLAACDPMSTPQSSTLPIRSYVTDLLGLSPEDYRAIAIPLWATLGAATTTGQNSYRVPNSHNLAITEIRGHLALTGMLTEKRFWDNTLDATLGVGTSTTPVDLLGRIAFKAMNVRVDLKNSDREQKIMDNKPLSLASILQLVGGSALDYKHAPHVVPAGETLLLDVSLVQAATNPVSIGDIEAGVVLVGVLIRSKNS